MIQHSDNSLAEFLVLLVIGVIGVHVALLGSFLDSFTFYVIGLIILIASVFNIVITAGRYTLEFIVALSDFKKRFKGKDK